MLLFETIPSLALAQSRRHYGSGARRLRHIWQKVVERTGLVQLRRRSVTRRRLAESLRRAS
jgi:hypothetical protein